MNSAHEPARLVRADRQHDEIERPEPRRDLGVLGRLKALVVLRVSVMKNYFLAPTTADSFNPASLASAAALSVASQVKSGSLRPKCPYAAVLQ